MSQTFNPFSLEGKTILVTGASSGIGQAIAIYCAKMGAQVVISGRNNDRLKTTKEKINKDNTIIIAADLTQEKDIKNIVCTTPALDGLVHSAGIGYRLPAKMTTRNDIDMVMQTNFQAPILLQSHLLSSKKIKKGASIVFIASKAYDYPSLGNSLYSASKGAIISYAKCISLELATRKIRVNCICPAMVWTPLIFQGGATPDVLKEEELKYPLKRYGTPEDIANLSIYLLSNASSWMTGSAIDITGGTLTL